MKNESDTREYRQTARARAVQETGARILRAFMDRMQDGWFDEIRLEDVANDAGVTVQTVIRRFGGKEGLLEASHMAIRDEIMSGRDLPDRDVVKAITAIIAEYEAQGLLIMRVLAQEDRYPQLKAMADEGRSTHRAWVGQLFAPWLSAFAPETRRLAQDRLVIALDLYVWKLLRVDMGRSVTELQNAMLEMAAAALATDPDSLLQHQVPETHNA